ncbi:hypothetical protein KC573_00445, partial [candidate division WWE3 bacterium]|nr:hypothetical protein [candidate division WWE3 bacterium]
MRVRKSLVLLIVSLQLWLVNILFLLNSDPFYLRSMLLLIFMVIGLGLLFLLPWHIKKIHLAELIVYSIGISIVMLMLVGLISNTVFNYLGFVAPLSAVHLLIVLDLLSILLLIINFCLKDKGDLFIKPIVFTAIDWIYFVIPPLFPIISVIGAVTLNNFGSEMYTMLLLAAIGMYVSLVVLFRR